MLDLSDSSSRTLLFRSLTATGSGIAAKVVGLINQIVSITLITDTLGAEGLEVQILAIASVSWFSLTFLGMYTALPVLLVRAGTNNEIFASIAKTAYLLALIGASFAVVLMMLILFSGAMHGSAAAPIATAMICNALVLVFSVSEKICQAVDRITQFNLLNAAGTVMSLATTFALSRTHGTAVEFVATFYLGIGFPLVASTWMVIRRLKLASGLSWRTFVECARRLVSTGVFSFGYEMAAYCKLQAPVALLSTLGLSNQIAPVGLGLRLVALISGGVSIMVPILLLRIGTAIQSDDREGRKLWIRLGLICAAAVALTAAGLFAVFGQTIYRLWTGGVVVLDWPQQAALAAFAAVFFAQNLLFPLTAPDPTVTSQLRWLFWLEGPAVIAVAVAGALAVPAIYGGAAMLSGAALVTGLAMMVLLGFLTIKHPTKEVIDQEV